MADLTAVVAAAAYLSAIVVLLGVRSWRQHRATGTAGFNGLRGAKTRAARVASVGFVPLLGRLRHAGDAAQVEAAQ